MKTLLRILSGSRDINLFETVHTVASVTHIRDIMLTFGNYRCSREKGRGCKRRAEHLTEACDKLPPLCFNCVWAQTHTQTHILEKPHFFSIQLFFRLMFLFIFYLFCLPTVNDGFTVKACSHGDQVQF